MDWDKLAAAASAATATFNKALEALKVPIETLFWWAVKHNFAVAIIDVTVCLLTWLCIAKYVKYLRWGFSPKSSEHSSSYSNFADNDGHCAIGIIWGIVTLIAVVMAMSWGYDGIERLAAPEFMTLQDLVQLLPKSK